MDPKWLEQMQNPMSTPSPRPASMESGYGSSAVKSHGGRPLSNLSSTSSSSHTQQQSSAAQSQAGGNSGSSKKNSRQQTAASAALDQAALQFGSLAGLNPSLLANLPGLGAFDPKNPLAAFDPKNPLLSMSFGGMPGMGNIPGLGNLNNMNLFASLAGMGGLGNLAGMDTQSLAALMAAAGPTLGGLTGASGGAGSGKSQAQSQSSATSSSSSASKKKQQQQQQQAQNEAAQLAAAISASTGGSGASGGKNAAASASQLAAGFPFLFPNPSLLYPPMGLGGLNPYSLGSSGLGSAYDQLAQQYNLLNGATSSASNTSSTQSKSHQSQSKSSQSRNTTASANSAASLMNAMASMGGGASTVTTPSTSASGSGRGRQSSSRNQSQTTPTAADMAQLSSLLMPGADPHLLESLSRMSNMDLAQATRLMSSLGMPPLSGTPSSSGGGNTSTSKRSSQAANEANVQAKEQQKWLESLARGALPTDLAALQAFSQGKMPSTSGSNTGTSTSSSKSSKAAATAAAAQLPQIPGMSSDFPQAFLAEMAAQAMAAAGGSLPLSGPGSLASLAGLTGGSAGGGGSSASGSTSHSSSKRQREQDAFKQQMDYYTKTLGLGSGISLIPTSSAGGSSASSSAANAAAAAYAAALDAEQQHQQQQKALSKRARGDLHPTKEELTALAAGLPLNLGASMSSIEKSLRGGSSSSSSSTPAPMTAEQDKVTLTPLNASGGGSGSSSSSAAAAGLAANLPSQTTITIAPPISSGASTSSERSERSESRISLTITNAADAAKLPPPYEEADELIIQPILKKPTAANPGSSHGGSVDDLDTAENTSAANLSGSSSSSAAAAAAAAAEENRRSSNRLKRPRSGNEQGSGSVEGQPPEKRRELRSTRHTRSSADASTLNLSTGSESGAEERNE